MEPCKNTDNLSKVNTYDSKNQFHSSKRPNSSTTSNYGHLILNDNTSVNVTTDNRNDFFLDPVEEETKKYEEENEIDYELKQKEKKDNLDNLLELFNKSDECFVPNLNEDKSKQEALKLIREKVSVEDQKYLDEFDKNINLIQERIADLITTEKDAVKTEYDNVIKLKGKFEEFKFIEKQKLVKEREKWFSMFCNDLNNKHNSDVLNLNIGGTTKLSTTRGTLTKFPLSVLALLFSGKYELPMYEGRIFLDRDGEPFVNLINYLRTGKFPIFDSRREELLFQNELNFWKIPCQQITNKEHGLIFCKKPIDSITTFVEFKVVINSKSRGKSHLFIGLVDRIKYKPENLISTLWKDSPSSFYWDVWNNKLIKTDENGSQVASVSGYGCNCEDSETKIAMKYCPISREISFVKDGIDQGVAFKNIPAGLHLSLDLWFEVGYIEIIQNATYQEKIYL